MIYLFRIISDEKQDFYRDLVIDGSDTFLDFHSVIQKDLGYDPTQLASFFITNDRWEKQQEITLIDMMQDPSVPAVTMEQVTLDEHISGESQRMIYVFDFFSERAFFIELLEASDQTSPRETPFIGHAQGDPPRQLSLDHLMGDEDDPGGMGSIDPDSDDDLWLDDLDEDLDEGLNEDLLDDGLPEDF